MAAITTTAATVTTISSSESMQKQAGLSSKEILEKQLADYTVAAMKEIVQDTFTRMQEYHKDVEKTLAEGTFYPQFYAKALKEKKQIKLHKWLLKKDKLHNGIAPKEYFKNSACKQTVSGYLPNHFLLLPGKSASDAIHALRKGLTFLGCGEVCQVAHYAALINVLTKEKFDAIFDGKEKDLCLSIGSRDALNPIKVLMDFVPKEKIGKPKVGQISYFSSIPQYNSKHLFGESTGHNAICIEEGAEPKFLAFGMDPKGLSQAQITAALHEDYNKSPMDQAIFHSDALAMKYLLKLSPIVLEKRQQLKTHTLTLPEFQRLGGGTNEGQVSFNIDRIAELVKSDIYNCKKLMKQWCKELN